MAVLDDGGPAELDTSAARVSVIVPALNEEKCIAATVSYLLRELQPPADEVIVVDGGSTDRWVIGFVISSVVLLWEVEWVGW